MSHAPSSGLGWTEAVAAVLAIAIATLAAPSPAQSADGTVGPPPALDRAAASASPDPIWPTLSIPDSANARSGYFDIETQPVALRFAPSVDGAQSGQPSVAVRDDRWNLVDLNGVARVSAFSRGALTAEDAALAAVPASLPRQSGTGVGVITKTPLYFGTAVRTDRSVYDFEMSRFRGARWTTSVFVGADTALGPVYLGTNKDRSGSRSTFLYLGRWF